MGPQDENPQQNLFSSDADRVSPSTRTVPILQTNAPTPPLSSGEPMEVNTPPSQPSPNAMSTTTTTTTTIMGPPTKMSPEAESNGLQEPGLVPPSNGNDASSSSPTNGNGSNGTAVISDPTQVSTSSTTGSTTTPNAAAAGLAGGQQPKVVQTAFIHKLYNMLEDPSIQHLISWSSSAESFVMSPSNDFSKVLSQYFKHTNISSFVRQLNMYGFHKVSDVFHTGNPESSLWEFKHGNGSFKRGNLTGLREIKRRASRHALVHRDSYPSSKQSMSQPGTPAEPMQPMPDAIDSRVNSLEHTIYDMHARLAKSEEATQFLHVRHQAVMEALSRSLQINQEMARAVLSIVPNPDAPIHRDIMTMQGEIQRQTDILRSLEEPLDPPLSSSRSYFSNLENAPVSPRQMAQDDPRRPSMVRGNPQSSNFYRPPVPSNLSITPRRYGSIGGSSSPSSLRTPVPQQPPPPHPLTTVQSPPTNLPRRHTSADIRIQGWQPTPSPFASGQSSTQWPSSPKRGPTTLNEDQRLRDSLSQYSIGAASHPHSRPTTPPPPLTNGSSADSLGTWSWGSARGEKFGSTSHSFKDNSAPPTRRGSMAHILNPADTQERDELHDDDREREEDRKRKRVQ